MGWQAFNTLIAIGLQGCRVLKRGLSAMSRCSHIGCINQLGRQHCLHCHCPVVLWWALWRCNCCGRINPKMSLSRQFMVLTAEEALPVDTTAKCCDQAIVGLEVSLSPPYYWLPFSFLLIEELRAETSTASIKGLKQYYSRLAASMRPLPKKMLSASLTQKHGG